MVNSRRTASRFGKIAPNIAESVLLKNDESCSRVYRNSVVVFPAEKDQQIHTHSHLLKEKREALLGPSAPVPCSLYDSLYALGCEGHGVRLLWFVGLHAANCRLCAAYLATIATGTPLCTHSRVEPAADAVRHAPYYATGE